MTTRAPAAARALLVSSPSPLFAPVTITVRPAWVGMLSAVQLITLRMY